MTYPSRALDGFDGLWHHPIRWFLRQFAFYLVIAAIFVPSVLAGAAIYSYLLRSEEGPLSIPAPNKKPVPIERPTPEKPIQLPSWTEIPMAELRERAIGAPVLFGDRQIGTVSDLIKNDEGQIVGIVINRKKFVPNNVPQYVPESLAVASNKLQWHGTAEQDVTGILLDGSVLNGTDVGLPH